MPRFNVTGFLCLTQNKSSKSTYVALWQTNIAGWKHGQFEDVFPIEHGDSSASNVTLPEGG